MAGVTYKLRSFLPDGREVFGVGHNILGAWEYLALGGFLSYTKSNGSSPVGWFREIYVLHGAWTVGYSRGGIAVTRTQWQNRGAFDLYGASLTQRLWTASRLSITGGKPRAPSAGHWAIFKSSNR
jgi:hypothetical protein